MGYLMTEPPNSSSRPGRPRQSRLPRIADVARLLQRGVQQGTLRSSAITREPRLILSPGIHAMLDCVVRGAAAPDAMSAWERLHVAMLRELLTP